jgi:hypothetical protein
MSAAGESRLRWAPSVRLESGVYAGRTLADVARVDAFYLCARARKPHPAWSHSLVVALRLIARELDCVEARAA